jgi:hypothetical protein
LNDWERVLKRIGDHDALLFLPLSHDKRVDRSGSAALRSAAEQRRLQPVVRPPFAVKAVAAHEIARHGCPLPVFAGREK